MTAATRTPRRPDDLPRKRHITAEVDARVGQPYVLEHRCGPFGRVVRLARVQRNGSVASIMFAPEDARAVAAALMSAADQLETE
ncbi:hypothetical protein L2K20_09960 [Mycobacterium sp. MBM]|nr:hypothetical protein [Mycobacterium sp. MBM]